MDSWLRPARLLPGTLAIVALVFAGCAEPAPSASGNDAAAPADAAATVTMQNMAFEPLDITIVPGDVVAWINEDSMGHTVTPVDPEQWGTEGSGDDAAHWLQRGQSWSHTFTAPGTYHYYCKPHAGMGPGGAYQGMVGTVHVEAGA